MLTVSLLIRSEGGEYSSWSHGKIAFLNKAAESTESVLEAMRLNTCIGKRGINAIVQVSGYVLMLISLGGLEYPVTNEG